MIDAKKSIIEVTKEKLIEKLKASGWDNILRLFILSDSFTAILEKLYEESSEGKHFAPTLKHVFRAFEECPLDKTNVIIIGQDPYFTLGVADGIAFSCSLTGKAQPSLTYMFKAIEKYIYPHVPSAVHTTMDPDLKRWSNQGVLMLNSAFTVQIGKPGTHVELWKPFMIYLLDQLCFRRKDLLFVLMGKQAHEYEDYISFHPIMKTSHPAHAAYTKSREWVDGDIFRKINDHLRKENKLPISW